MQEQLQPLTDELIQRCLSIGPWEYNGKPLWHRILDFAMDAGEPMTGMRPSETQQCPAALLAHQPRLSCMPERGSVLQSH